MIKEIALSSIVSFGQAYVDLIDPYDASYQCGVNHNRLNRVIELSIEHDLSVDVIYATSKTVRNIVEVWTQCESRGYVYPDGH